MIVNVMAKGWKTLSFALTGGLRILPESIQKWRTRMLYATVFNVFFMHSFGGENVDIVTQKGEIQYPWNSQGDR
jgi:hypothetical protein